MCIRDRVRVEDDDFLYDSYYGIIGSALREMIYSIGLPAEEAKEARYSRKIKIHFGHSVRSNKEVPYVQVIMSYRCPDDFGVSKESLAVNQLSWVKLRDIHDTQNFDAVSKSLIDRFKTIKAILAI